MLVKKLFILTIALCMTFNPSYGYMTVANGQKTLDSYAVLAMSQQLGNGQLCIASTMGRPELVPSFLEVADSQENMDREIINNLTSYFPICTQEQEEMTYNEVENFYLEETFNENRSSLNTVPYSNYRIGQMNKLGMNNLGIFNFMSTGNDFFNKIFVFSSMTASKKKILMTTSGESKDTENGNGNGSDSVGSKALKTLGKGCIFGIFGSVANRVMQLGSNIEETDENLAIMVFLLMIIASAVGGTSAAVAGASTPGAGAIVGGSVGIGLLVCGGSTSYILRDKVNMW